MSETDSPDQGSGSDSALSVADGAAAIENLLSSVPDEDQDSVTSEESQNAGQAEAVDNAEQAPDDTDGLEFDDEASGTEKDAPEEPAFKNGQFASRDAKVKMDDGSTISVADLVAGNMFQRTFTEKTTALSQDRKALEAERNQFAETKQQIEHQRNVILTLAQELLPQEPQPVNSDEDPVGYIKYLEARDHYQGKMNRLMNLWNSAQQEQTQLTERQKQEQEAAQQAQQEKFLEMLASEKDKLHKFMPRLKDDKEREKFLADAIEIGKSVYGIPEEEIRSIPDHRYLRVYADAMAYRKAIAKRDAAKTPTPAAQAQAQQPRIQQKQRMATTTPQVRDQSQAVDRLRKSGSISDAAKALERFV